jgi:predicted small integral membrane protein
MLRTTKIILIGVVALWALLGAFLNVHDWSGTTGALAATTSMTTFEGGADDWRATSSSLVIWVGALFIILSKVTTGILCLMGALKMWGARTGDASAFAKSKELALSGCGIAMIFLFAGWIVIAETWFELWRSDVMRDLALQSAFRYGAMITLIALFVATRDD